ncbi:MAG: oxidoreductase [Sphingobacteriales bacterium SCN 48-20]|jgi:predicted dehydrogenase|uniref:Gfo/Idh/MocA family oxidoreductase n=1 Tax=Terrimonas ferruginea TaxID=249 RepID=UPI00086C36BF|nr:Gfo/Idh/MocA family oxidoreductase [Terrimonas ferruginea]MBN8782871.1 Gfo/Idh/MocA family oxidoreductase [Terrimonas ferruginea]ODT92767.1 MAG: oxidoreductase [Sphingobacteriales bacterium SCN 48-20]OJW44067.1 MAG: oxidoreductase [Sphingobacteriales bacterium 48-107]
MLRIGIIGVGHLGKFHLNNWREISGVEVVGFYDPDDDNAKAVSDKYQLPRFLDADTLLGAVDAIDVVAPTNHHFVWCEKAIRMGKHVFVEKPLAHTMEEARQLVKLAKESNIKMQVGHVERFNPAFLALKDVTLSPMFIEVHRLAQFNPRGTEVSVILDLMIHDIDIILSIVNSDVKHISASGVAVLTDTPDIANVRIEFDNGCVANLTSSRISMKKMRKMRIFQKDAYIGVDFLNKKTEIIKLKEPSDTNVFAFDIDTPNGGKKTIAVANPEVPEVNAIKRELEEFRDAILNNTRTVVSEIDGLMAMDVAHQILSKIGNNVITR